MPFRYIASYVRDALTDPERLRVLKSTALMDSAHEELLDRWALVAAEALHAPIALISLVDDHRQFFKSAVGLDGIATDERETALTHSFCQYVVAGGRQLAVGDARCHAELRGNPAVEELGVVAYAGSPVVVSGQTLGSLCVIESQARTWTAAELRLLDQLAEGLSHEIGLRLANAAVARASRLTEAHNAIHEQIASDRPLTSILAGIAASIEMHDPGLRATITVGEVADEASPDRWSFPVAAERGRALGTLTVRSRQEREPSTIDLQFLHDAARLAGIAIERRQSHDRLVFDATHDALTGLTNRVAALERLDAMLCAQAPSSWPLSVLFVDLDRVKAISDLLGHDTGDLVIQQAARRIGECAGPGDLVARQDGEQFLIACAGGDDHATALAQRVISSVRAPLATPMQLHELAVTASIGITVITEAGLDAATAIRRADTALYAAKARGGNQYAFGDRTDLVALTRRLRLENALRRAIERDELSLVYQPLQCFAGEQPVAVEALIRWQHPELGRVGPDEFIPIAEQTGLIDEIGAWVLHTACSDLPGLSAQHRCELQLGINVSAQQLRDPDFPEVVAAALATNGLTADRLYVEITETALLSSDEMTMRIVCGLDAMGVHIALDDFGTGYSSLAVLKRYPIKAIKIDRCFVDGLPESGDDLAIVSALIGMGHSLGLAVVAEGVETAAQHRTLAELGCDLAQGYLIGRPAPAPAAAAAGAA